MIVHPLRIVLAIGVLMTLPVTPTPTTAIAQEAETAESLTSADVDDAELERFTRALTSVLEIQGQLEEDLAAAETPEEEQQTREAANLEMVEAIRGNELEVERFNLITASVNQDVELNQRYQAMREQLAESAEG